MSLALTFSGGLLFAANESEQTQQQLEAIKQQIKDVQSRLSAQQKEYGAAATQLKRAEQKINSAAKILRATQRQIRLQTDSLKQNRRRQGDLQKEQLRHQDILAQQMRAAYSGGRQEYLKLLLNQEDPEKLGRMLAYYDYLSRARTESIHRLGNTIVELTTLTATIEQELKTLAVLERAQIKEQERLRSLKQEREKAVKALAQSIATEDKKLSNLRENEEELESILRRMEQALKDIIKEQNLEGLAKMKGKLTWPLKGRVILNYRERITRELRSNGIRIAASEGSEVAAVFHGRVIFSDWLRGFGLLLILDHGDGYMSLYGNNQSLFKEVGDWVEAGELISTVGASGGQPTPGLYFEIRHQGNARNPKEWIRG